MIATPVSAERVQKCVFNFEIYRFLKKTANLSHPLLPKHCKGLDCLDCNMMLDEIIPCVVFTHFLRTFPEP